MSNPQTTKTQIAHGETFVTVPTRLKIPMLPNFIITMTDEGIPLVQLTREQVAAIGDAWAKELLDKWQMQKNAQPRKKP